MRNYFIFVIIVLSSITKLEAQILKTQLVLHKLEIEDTGFRTQLDSILFIDYPCTSKGNNIYFVNINEDKLNTYSVFVILLKPSSVERGINTGIYKNNDNIFIIRENISNYPLFRVTSEIEKFYYEKILVPVGGDSRYLEELISPTDPCVWFLTYVNQKLEVKEVRGIYKKIE